jgi:hypothetical protein
MALVEKGTLEKPDCFIFADTQAEPKAVYDHLEFCSQKASALGVPLYKVTNGSLADDWFQGIEGDGEKHFAGIPFFVRNPDGTTAMMRRQCTSEYKVRPIRMKIRELFGAKPGERLPYQGVECWMGISTDEMRRVRQSEDRWQVNRYPLIDLGMSRASCLAFLKEAGWPTPPRSACVFCPFHSDYEWRSIKENPETWASAVEFDRKLRTIARFRGEAYLHRSMKPLDQVDFRTSEEAGQTSLWSSECLGMCGI